MPGPSDRERELQPTSIHFFSCSLYEKISIDGSVYGLYAGLKRRRGSPRRVKNCGASVDAEQGASRGWYAAEAYLQAGRETGA
jgi:hypothetical protein